MMLTRKIKYAMWKLNGYLGWRLSLDIPQKVTVLITYYNPARMQHADSQIRNLLKCSFIDCIVISNHNPEIQIEDQVRIRDQRLIFINQPVHRGCGYRWFIANTINPEYLIVVDDDVLLFPKQLAKLFIHLVREPRIPHGFAGMMQLGNEKIEYREAEELTIDFLCEGYAITRDHLKQYVVLRSLIGNSETIAAMVDVAQDFLVISQTGDHKPKIHNIGRVFRCETFKEAGVAVHKNDGFNRGMSEVQLALKTIVSQARNPSNSGTR